MSMQAFESLTASFHRWDEFVVRAKEKGVLLAHDKRYSLRGTDWFELPE